MDEDRDERDQPIPREEHSIASVKKESDVKKEKKENDKEKEKKRRILERPHRNHDLDRIFLLLMPPNPSQKQSQFNGSMIKPRIEDQLSSSPGTALTTLRDVIDQNLSSNEIDSCRTCHKEDSMAFNTYRNSSNWALVIQFCNSKSTWSN